MLYVSYHSKERATIRYLMRRSVGQYFRHSLWACNILYKAFHPTTIPEDLRANQERKYVHLSRSSHLYLG